MSYLRGRLRQTFRQFIFSELEPIILTCTVHDSQSPPLVFKQNLERTATVATQKQLFPATALPGIFDGDGLKMKAWQIHCYGGLETVRLSESARRPFVQHPKEVLVQVLSSSVNPIDVAMIDGRGKVMLNAMRQVNSLSFDEPPVFPLTLGRDFCGRVVSKGHAVTSLTVGDEVWGATPPHSHGCHADYVLVNELLVHKKPACLTTVEAGSMLYAGMAAWSALKLSAGLYFRSATDKSVLVMGAAGGVGQMAVQLLKAWGSRVVATCQHDAIPLLEALGVDSVIDYSLPDAMNLIREEGKYDIILNCAGRGSDSAPQYADCLKDWNCSTFVTLDSPLLDNGDSYGLVGGMVKNAVDLLIPNVKTLQTSKSSTVRWAFFAPLPVALREISTLVQEGKICPTVEQVFQFDKLPDAYDRVRRGHLRGKVVISMET